MRYTQHWCHYFLCSFCHFSSFFCVIILMEVSAELMPGSQGRLLVTLWGSLYHLSRCVKGRCEGFAKLGTFISFKPGLKFAAVLVR